MAARRGEAEFADVRGPPGGVAGRRMSRASNAAAEATGWRRCRRSSQPSWLPWPWPREAEFLVVVPIALTLGADRSPVAVSGSNVFRRGAASRLYWEHNKPCRRGANDIEGRLAARRAVDFVLW
uniref:Uncharacterized protein n=1 Tax=Oryza nivara TaxID=4536 RepID=A0A0E0FYW0_ORYNI